MIFLKKQDQWLGLNTRMGSLPGRECPCGGIFGFEDQDVEADSPGEASGCVVIHPLSGPLDKSFKPFICSCWIRWWW